MNNRVKALKRQLDESEEEVQREKVGKRKAQRELEDILETHESLTRECNNLRNKLRWVCCCQGQRHLSTAHYITRYREVDTLIIVRAFAW